MQNIFGKVTLKIGLFLALFFSISSAEAVGYSVLDAEYYRHNVNNTRIKIQELLSKLSSDDSQNRNLSIAFISQQLSDIPYAYTDAMGEGDWQPNALTYRPGAVHIKQDPVYRLDALDCQTFVQVTMSLLHSKNLDEFDKNILRIAYGAAGNKDKDIVHFYNRNIFIESDWNRANQQNGWLRDITATGELESFSAIHSVELNRKNWFLFQQKPPSSMVRVLAKENGAAMVKRFKESYSQENYPHFSSEKISIAYIPKEKLVSLQNDGSYKKNNTVLNKISTPAIVEIIRDAKKYTIQGKKITELIGSEISVFHMGILYRQAFKRNELIYKKISCNFDRKYQKICTVTPVICEKERCNELMFSHATNAYPDNYYWYQQPEGNFICTNKLPKKGIAYSSCNRVVQIPFFNYLTDYQYGSYWYMHDPSFLGVHIEKLL